RDLMLPCIFATPKLSFTYIVGTKMHASVDYSYSIDPLGPKQKQVDLDLPVGSQTTAYYNSIDPTQAVLKPGFNQHFYLNLLIAFSLIAVGVYWLTRSDPDKAV
ncbi:MAG: hypothetical protein ACRD3W_01285, partial [Terriglobales bacterium]